MACPLPASPNVSSGAAGAAQGRSWPNPLGHLQSGNHDRATACGHHRRGRTNETGAAILHIAHRRGAGGEWGSYLSRSRQPGLAVASITLFEKQFETMASKGEAVADGVGKLPERRRRSFDRRAGIEALSGLEDRCERYLNRDSAMV